MDLYLKNKTAIIMAAGAGIGRGIAVQFALEGAQVILFDRDKSGLEETERIIREKTGQNVLAITGDITRPEDIERLTETTADKSGSVYALVNNTGGPPAGGFSDFTDGDWTRAYELTLLAYIRTIRNVLPLMKKNGRGRIVCNTSSSIKRVIDNLILSNVFRMGILGLCKSLARELGPDNILVNVIGPGKIDTERVAYIDALKAGKMNISPEKLRSEIEANIPLGRYGTAEEIARLIVFLCSDANTYITGQSILVDGGQVAAY